MRVQAIFKRILLQRRGDKRSLALLFIVPPIILTLMYFLMQVPANVRYRVGLVNETSTTQLSDKIKKQSKFTVVSADNDSQSTMNTKNLDAIISINWDNVTVTYANQSTSSTQVIKSIVTQLVQETQAQAAQSQTQEALNKLTEQLVKASPRAAPQIESQIKSLENTPTYPVKSRYLYGDSNLSTFNDMAPAFIGGFVFFFVFLISGISLVNERSSGTLERMLVTPVKRNEIVAGYTLAYGLLALLQTGVIVLWSHFVLRVPVSGSLTWVFVINFLLAMIALLTGLLFSALAKTEFQFVQFIPIVVVPQFLFSGIINVSTMSEPLQWIAHVTPVYYAITALQLVIKRGQAFSSIWPELLILVFIGLALYIGNVFALKTLRRT